MPREYSKYFRWRAIWLTEIVGVDVQDASFYLQLLKKTISRYIHKFRECQEMSTRLSSVLGHILAYQCTRTSQEQVVMELLLQHPEKTIAELLDQLYQETGSEYARSLLFETKQHNAKEGQRALTYIKLTNECSNLFIAKQNCTTEMRRYES